VLLKEIKNIFHSELDMLYGKEEVASFFYLLIEHFFGLERFILAIQPDVVIDKEQETLIFHALSELKVEKPIQHILGVAHFMDLDFKVNEHVLIPRPETEELVRWILEDAKVVNNTLTILDMGTGSGCIPISLNANLPNAKVYGLDISQEAIKVAYENNKTHGTNVEFLCADILHLEHNDIQDEVLKQGFDVMVSNPPYVRELEKSDMRKNVLKHEPNLALFVSDKNPLQFYKSIVAYASMHLNEKGRLYLEINQYLGREMIELLKKYDFQTIELRQDLFGNDRMLKGVKK